MKMEDEGSTIFFTHQRIINQDTSNSTRKKNEEIILYCFIDYWDCVSKKINTWK